MNVRHVIVHRIDKELGGKPDVLISVGPPPEEDLAVELVSQLHAAFDNNVTYGRFDDANLLFRQDLDAYLADSSRKVFVDNTQHMVRELASRLSSIGPARGGYFVFADYVVNAVASFFSVFLIRNTRSMLFQRKGDVFSIAQITHIDIDRLAMAARINLNRYDTLDGRYVSLVRRRIPDISDYFIEWIGVVDPESNKQDTLNLKTVLSSSSLPPFADGSPAEPAAVLDRAFSFIKESPGRQVSIGTLSDFLFGNPLVIHSLAEERGIELNSEFRADRHTLNTFRIISVQTSGYRLDFPMQQFQQTVRVDPDNPTRVVIDSEALARQIVSATNYE